MLFRFAAPCDANVEAIRTIWYYDNMNIFFVPRDRAKQSTWQFLQKHCLKIYILWYITTSCIKCENASLPFCVNYLATCELDLDLTSFICVKCVTYFSSDSDTSNVIITMFWFFPEFNTSTIGWKERWSIMWSYANF